MAKMVWTKARKRKMIETRRINLANKRAREAAGTTLIPLDAVPRPKTTLKVTRIYGNAGPFDNETLVLLVKLLAQQLSKKKA